MSSEVTGPLPPTFLPFFSSLLQLSSLLDRCFSESPLLTRHLHSHFLTLLPQLLEALRLPPGVKPVQKPVRLLLAEACGKL